jgi:hypothetical protein
MSINYFILTILKIYNTIAFKSKNIVFIMNMKWAVTDAVWSSNLLWWAVESWMNTKWKICGGDSIVPTKISLAIDLGMGRESQLDLLPFTSSWLLSWAVFCGGISGWEPLTSPSFFVGWQLHFLWRESNWAYLFLPNLITKGGMSGCRER